MSPHVLVNGSATDRISVFDRGLHYGDGLFETIAVRGGALPLWERHMRRLRHGCERLNLPFADYDLLEREAASLCRDGDGGVLKIMLTRGEGRGYAPAPTPRITRVLIRYAPTPHPAQYWSEGVSISVCAGRLGINPALAGLKHLNRLEQVICAADSGLSKHAEALVLDVDEFVIEATTSNVFIAKAGRLATPELSRCGVAGVMRELLLDRIREEGMTCEVRAVTLDEVRRAEELFLCNSVNGVWPVRRLDDQAFRVGPLTRNLQRAVDSLLPRAE